ncbi:hypothetical protein TRIUR3_17100 [Triticum urartu]|uniref:Uncharacterized protein n=1 Tax=Triticum urartu TaxID=4572 RepID=M7YDW9_TRIUA|nr:hypothetical protein TRIUR3_17100 [Triticum urartu]
MDDCSDDLLNLKDKWMFLVLTYELVKKSKAKKDSNNPKRPPERCLSPHVCKVGGEKWKGTRHAKQQQGEGVSEMLPMSLIASITD